VIVNLIGATTTRSGLEVYARLDEREYPKGIAVSDAEPVAATRCSTALPLRAESRFSAIEGP